MASLDPFREKIIGIFQPVENEKSTPEKKLMSVTGITERDDGSVSASFGDGSVAQQYYDATPEWLKYFTTPSYTTADIENGDYTVSTNFENDVQNVASGFGYSLLKYGAWAALALIGFEMLKEFGVTQARKAAS